MLDSLRSLAPWWWVAASILASVLGANLSWRIHGWTYGRGGRIATALRRLGQAPLLAWMGGLVYNIGVPYSALLLGVLDTRLTGLAYAEWPQAIAYGAAIGAATGVLLWLDRRYRTGFDVAAGAPVSAPSWLAIVWRVAFQQAHWGFYRAVAVARLGLYGGSLAGLVVILAELSLNPFWRAGWDSTATNTSLAFDLALLLTTTIVFAATGSFWVGAAVHMLLALAILKSERGILSEPPSAEGISARSYRP